MEFTIINVRKMGFRLLINVKKLEFIVIIVEIWDLESMWKIGIYNYHSKNFGIYNYQCENLGFRTINVKNWDLELSMWKFGI